VGGYFTPEEADAAYELFEAANWARIRRAGISLTGSADAARDLAQEAIARTLAGERKCPRSVDLTFFTIQAMRSIASAAAKAQPARANLPLELVGNNDWHRAAGEAGQRTPEDQLIDEQEDAIFVQNISHVRQRVLALFADDPVTSCIAEGIMEGMEGAALCELADIDAKQLATIRRSIRRSVERAFPDGWRDAR